MNKLIDIHCHLLYGVDDGAENKTESVEMLKRAKSQGITDIFLTPHYRHGMFPYRNDDVERNYIELQQIAHDIGVNIFLGTEYHVNSQIVENFRNNRCHALGDSKYILMEYSHDTDFSFMRKMTQEVVANGFFPLVVHVERYACLTEDIGLVEELREMGSWIQNNADAVLGLEGRRARKFCKRLLKNGLTDIIASDSHGIDSRVCNLRKCYDYVAKKISQEYADILFELNPQKILNEIKNN